MMAVDGRGAAAARRLAILLGSALVASGCARSRSPQVTERTITLARGRFLVPDSFARPRGIAVSDGAVFLSDGVTQHVLRLNAEGVLEGVYGHPGSGPGELRGPQGIAVDDSLLAVVEMGNARLSLFARRSGQFIRIVRLPYLVMSVGILPDGRFVIPARSDSAALAVLDGSGGVTQVGHRPALPPGVRPTFPGFPLAARSDLILISGDTVFVADAAVGSLTAHSVDGTLLRTYWIPADARADIDHAIGQSVHAFGNKLMFSSMFRAMVRGSDGDIWLTVPSRDIAALRIDPRTWATQVVRLSKPTFSAHTTFNVGGRLEMVTTEGLRIFP